MADQRPLDFKNIAANGTTVLGSAGVGLRLHKLIFNKIGAAANVITLYDGQDTNGRLIGTIDSTIASAREIHYGGIPLKNGLTVVLATGTAADITILFE